jgi:hypothetical protein
VRVQTYACDVCKRPKEAVNRWFLITIGSGLILQAWDGATPEEIAQADYHLCGEAHALQIAAKWMAEKSGVVKTVEAHCIACGYKVCICNSFNPEYR